MTRAIICTLLSFKDIVGVSKLACGYQSLPPYPTPYPF